MTRRLAVGRLGALLALAAAYEPARAREATTARAVATQAATTNPTTARATATGGDPLRSGPMAGFSEPREVLLWVQTRQAARVRFVYWDEAEPQTRHATAETTTRAQDAFVAKLVADAVRPGRRYLYEVHVDGVKVERAYPLRFQARPLDVDILFYADRVISVSDTLHIPHLLLHERAFVLRPLADLAPEFEHPTLYRTVRELLAEVEDEHDVRRGDYPGRWFEDAGAR